MWCLAPVLESRTKQNSCFASNCPLKSSHLVFKETFQLSSVCFDPASLCLYRALVSLLQDEDAEDVKWLFSSCWLHIWYQLVCTTQLRRCWSFQPALGRLFAAASFGQQAALMGVRLPVGLGGLQLSPPGQTFLSQHPYWIRTPNLLTSISGWGPNLQCVPSSIQIWCLSLNFCNHMLIVFGFVFKNDALKMMCVLLCDMLLAA